jgi:hypothetical protein
VSAYSADIQPEGVDRVKDRDGRVWHRAGDGLWWLPPAGELRSWGEVWLFFGPLGSAERDEQQVRNAVARDGGPDA